MKSYPSGSHRHAFTLIELLVVISIIALLLGILLPALGQVRRSAQSMQCLSNMRQLAIATVNYALDHDATLPTVGFSHGGETFPQQGSWFFLLEDYNGGEAGKLAYRCPSDESPAWETPQGTPPRLRRVSYGINFMLTPFFEEGADNLDRIPAPSSTSFAAELAETSAAGFATADHFHPETWLGSPEFHDQTIRPQLEIEQHLGKANYTFLDGHASTLPRSDVFEVAPGATIFNLSFTANKFWPQFAK